MDLSHLPITRTLVFEAIGAIGASIGAFIVWRIRTRVQKILPKKQKSLGQLVESFVEIASLCEQIGVSVEEFLQALSTFQEINTQSNSEQKEDI